MKILILLTGMIFLPMILNGQNALNCAEFLEIMHDDSVLILDVRKYDDFSNERIKNAVYAGEKEILTELIRDLKKDRSILIYCKKGVRSHEVFKILKKEGFKNIRELKDGFSEWKEEGYPVDSLSGNSCMIKDEKTEDRDIPKN